MMEIELKISRPDATKMVAEIQRFSADCVWMDEMRDELLIAYPDEFVAVLNQVVIGSNSDLDFLLRDLRQRNFDTGSLKIERIVSNPIPLVLPKFDLIAT